MKKYRKIFIYIIAGLCLSYCLCCYYFQYHEYPTFSPEERELREIYRNYLRITAEAVRTGDGSGLETVATGDALQWAQRRAEQTKINGGVGSWEEYSRIHFYLINLGLDSAELEFSGWRDSFGINRETGEKHRIGGRLEVHHVNFIRIDGVWKVSEVSQEIIND